MIWNLVLVAYVAEHMTEFQEAVQKAAQRMGKEQVENGGLLVSLHLPDEVQGIVTRFRSRAEADSNLRHRQDGTERRHRLHHLEDRTGSRHSSRGS